MFGAQVWEGAQKLFLGGGGECLQCGSLSQTPEGEEDLGVGACLETQQKWLSRSDKWSSQKTPHPQETSQGERKTPELNRLNFTALSLSAILPQPWSPAVPRHMGCGGYPPPFSSRRPAPPLHDSCGPPSRWPGSKPLRGWGSQSADTRGAGSLWVPHQ